MLAPQGLQDPRGLDGHARDQAAALELFHQVFPHCPHTRTLAVDVHGDRGQHAHQLYTTNRNESVFRPTGLEPMWEEQREDKAVQNVCGLVSFGLAHMKTSAVLDTASSEIQKHWGTYFC
jgi:hypothetical protein